MLNKKLVAAVAIVAVTSIILLQVRSATAEVEWPPRLNEPYPDLQLIDQTGELVRLANFKGSVILVEYVGMTCPACQAFAGAHRVGSFANVTPQKGLESIEDYFPRHAGGLTLDDERVIFVQVLLYSMTMKAPTPEDAESWARHFKLDRSRNQIVLAGRKELLGEASYKLIPGFQLIDKNFILRSDSTGHHPRHNLYEELLPMVPELVHETSTARERSPRSDDPSASVAQSMSVEEAYRSIPHRQTVFDVDAARMSSAESEFLERFFQLYRSDQLPDRLSSIEQVMGPATGVRDGRGAEVDPEIAIKGREHVLVMYRARDGGAGGPICRTDHLADLHPAPGEHGHADARPVVPSPRLGIDSGSSSKLAPDHDRHVV